MTMLSVNELAERLGLQEPEKYAVKATQERLNRWINTHMGNSAGSAGGRATDAFRAFMSCSTGRSTELLLELLSQISDNPDEATVLVHSHGTYHMIQLREMIGSWAGTFVWLIGTFVWIITKGMCIMSTCRCGEPGIHPTWLRAEGLTWLCPPCVEQIKARARPLTAFSQRVGYAIPEMRAHWEVSPRCRNLAFRTVDAAQEGPSVRFVDPSDGLHTHYECKCGWRGKILWNPRNRSRTHPDRTKSWTFVDFIGSTIPDRPNANGDVFGKSCIALVMAEWRKKQLFGGRYSIGPKRLKETLVDNHKFDQELAIRSVSVGAVDNRSSYLEPLAEFYRDMPICDGTEDPVEITGVDPGHARGDRTGIVMGHVSMNGDVTYQHKVYKQRMQWMSPEEIKLAEENKARVERTMREDPRRNMTPPKKLPEPCPDSEHDKGVLEICSRCGWTLMELYQRREQEKEE